jgi:class 3 adenylate cyclase/tetratricopeptide (TPR) repeat protein
MRCHQCSFDNPHDYRYCGRCGSRDPAQEVVLDRHQAERKNVTILFSDLSEYTRISEKFDPEDVQTIMREIFDNSRHIIQSFGGSVERFLGDEIMAIFGHPIAHEDDAVRAINAARKIHRMVNAVTTRGIIDHPLQMHSGINTGMVITSGTSHNRLSIGITGDAANMAKRIQSLANPGEILVGRETYRQSAGHFRFHRLHGQPVKGKSRAVSTYLYMGPQKKPRKVRRVFGRRAELIAREKEIEAFSRAINNLKRGRGSVMCISGEVGTGKSRLAEEFKKRLQLDQFIWWEGYAYEFTKNNSYFPLINLFRREFGILEDDPPESIREKIHRETARRTGNTGLTDAIGSLFALESRSDASGELIDPEYWKSNLHRAITRLFDAMSAQKPVVACFEDLHWSDPSTIDLLASLFTDCTGPILFLLIFRPPFEDHLPGLIDAVKDKTTLLQIGDLVPRDCGRMVGSLLGTATVPDCLQRFVEKEVPGNPFFLEETINALIESETIIPSEKTWKLNRPIGQMEIALTVQGVIASRIDRLEAGAKEVLRKASVIGSSFSSDILCAISPENGQLNSCLEDLVGLDLIRAKRRSPSMQYRFKHVMIREVVYDGILKSERRAIHACIASCIENLFCEQLPEHFETLAYHFKQAGAIDKAITYLMHSGRKSLRRYAVEEAHRYYREAFDLIKGLEECDSNKEQRLVEALANWLPVYYYRGRFGPAEKRMSAYLHQAHAIEDSELRGVYYIGYGMCLWARERFQDAYEYMHRALKIGQAISSLSVEGYAHAWLTWVCIELGLPEESLAHGRAARALAEHFDSGHYPYYRSFDSDGFAHMLTGDCNRIMACSRALFEYGKASSSGRVTTWASFIKGLGQITGGSFKAATDSIREALSTSADPLYTMFPKLFLAIAFFSNGNYRSSREPLQEILDHGRRYGCEFISTPAAFFMSLSRCIDGNMKKNLRNIKKMIRHWEKHGARWRIVWAEAALGEFYLNLRLREISLPLSVILRNLPFLMVAVPLAARSTEFHYNRAITMAEKVGAKGMQGQAYLGLARLFHRQGQQPKAIDAIGRSLALFEMCEAEGFIRSANRLKSTIEAS